MLVNRLTTAATLLFSASLACSVHAQGMPEKLKKQIDENLIGSWEMTTTFDGKDETAHSVFQWSHGKESIIEQGTNHDPAYTFTQVGGWDPVSKAFVFHIYTSRGDRGTATYDKLTKEKWTGHGEGFWEGKDWKSAITLSWTNDGFRYEDVTEGKPFVVVGKRLAKSESESALKSFTGFMEGTWTRKDDGFVREHVYAWTSERKFLRSNGNKDPLPWDGMIGIDESNGKVGWWGFFANGNSGVIHLVESSDKRWIFEGVDYGPEGPFHRQVIVDKVNEDQLHAKVTDTVDGTSEVLFEEDWNRK